MIFAVEAAAEGGNICADTIQAFLPQAAPQTALLRDGKRGAGMFQATNRGKPPATFEQTKNCQHGNNCQRVNQQRCESHLDMQTFLTIYIISESPLEQVTMLSSKDNKFQVYQTKCLIQVIIGLSHLHHHRFTLPILLDGPHHFLAFSLQLNTFILV